MLFTSTENPLFNSIYSQAISYLVISHSFDVVNKMARKLIRELHVTENDITRICSTSEPQNYSWRTTTLHVYNNLTRVMDSWYINKCMPCQTIFLKNDTNMFMLLVRWTATRRRDENKL